MISLNLHSIYYVQSTNKSNPLHKTIAVKPSISGSTIQWKNKERIAIQLQAEAETRNLDLIHLFIGNEEVVTLTKLQTRDKNRYATALERSIREYANTLPFEYDPASPIPPVEKKENFERNLRASLINCGLKKYFSTALQELKKEGTESAYTELKAALNSKEFAISHLSQSAFDTIFNLAIVNYQKEEDFKSLSLFVALTILKPQESDLWHRTAITAQSCKNYPLAIKAYKVAYCLKPKLSFEAHLSSAECYLKLGMVNKAQEEYEKAKKLNGRKDHLDYVKSLFPQG